MYVTAFNPGDSPVVVSESGRSIGGGEWGTVETTDPIGKVGFDNEWLQKVDHPESYDGLNPQAAAAMQQTDEWSKKQEQAQSADKDVLLADARQRGLVQETDEPHKASLVALYTEGGHDIPTKASVRRAQQNEKKEG